jgi:PQQ-dependent catabolism-associated beta-propeller protein
MVHWIDTKAFKLIDNTLVDQRPRYAVFTKDGKTLWVSSEVGGTVALLDVKARKIVSRIAFQIPGIAKDRIQPVGIVFTPDETLAFVALGPANHVAVVNTKTLKVMTYILVGRRVWHLAVTADGGKLFTTNGISGDVTVVDAKTFRPIKTIKVGRFPWGVTIRPSKPTR